MKLRILSAVLALAATLHAAPPATFVWQGKSIDAGQLQRVDATTTRLPDGTVIPLSAVPPLLRAGLAPAKPGTLLSQRVLQILPDGLLLIRAPEVHSDWSKDEKRWIRWEREFEPILLRGHPVQGGMKPDSTVTCYAEPDGGYTYTTLRGEVKNVEAWKWAGPPQAVPVPEIIRGSKISGSALDRK